MAVDLLESNRVNIKDLTLPEVRETPKSIVDQLLTGTDKENLINHGKKVAFHIKGPYAVCVAVLYPERLKDLDLESRWRNSVWHDSSEHWQELRRLHTDWYRFARYTRELMILFPEKMNKMVQDNPLETEDIAQMKEHILVSRRAKLWNILEENQTTEIAAALKLLAPNQLPDPLFTEEQWADMIKSFEGNLRKGNIFYFFTQAINMKILSGVTGLSVDLPSQAQQLAQEYLLERKADVDANNNPEFWEPVAEVAAGLKVLAAEEVTITDQGLQLNFAKRTSKLEQSIPDLPARRKF